MWRVGIGLCVGMALMAPWVSAFRIPSPPTINEWNASAIAQLNTYLQSIWQLTNGRLEMDTVTSDPDGARLGQKGQFVLFDTGTNQLCVNVDNAFDWDCAALSP